jgi:hypothetical protein
MPSATAALHAGVGRRVAAAVLAAALQAVFYWLMVRETIEPTVLQRSLPVVLTLFEVPMRSKPAAMPRQPRRRMPTSEVVLKEEAPSSPPVAHPITLPRALARSARPPIDWQQAIQGEVRELESRSHASKRRFGFPQMTTPAPPMPPFGWDYAHTHRLESLPGGGTIINVTDRCALVFYGILIPVCKIGHIPVNGHLFDDMRERRRRRQGGLP